ncbi:hypothetical protein EMIT0357P_10728 [Pseudomonas marginalis]
MTKHLLQLTLVQKARLIRSKI